jgi:hypothetical protein
LDREVKENRLYLIACRYSALGKTALAYEYLDKAAQAQDPDMLAMMYDLHWDRSDERFKQAARKFGLMQ